MALFEEAIYVEKLVEFSWVILREGCLLAYDLIYRRQSNMKGWLSKGVDNSKRVVNLRDRSNKIALALASIHFYSGICTGTGNNFIGEFCMNMLRWFWESTPKWLSFKMRLSFWLQLTYWYDQMRNKDWHFRVAWPGGEPSTSRVTGRCLIHYTTSDSVNYDGFTRTVSSVNIKSTNFEEKIIPGI